MGVGLTANLETDLDELMPYVDQVDDVMLMSIPPGWSGQTTDPEVYPRLEAMRKEIDRLGLDVPLEIDGGVNVANAQRAVDAGATVLVAASGIFHEPDPAAAAQRLAEIARGEVAA